MGSEISNTEELQAAPSRPPSSRLVVSATDGGADGCDCLSRQPSSGRHSQGRMAGWGDDRCRRSHSGPRPSALSPPHHHPRQSPIVFYGRRPPLSPSSTPFPVGRHRFPHSLLPSRELSLYLHPSSSPVIVRIRFLTFSTVFCFRPDLPSSSLFIIRLRSRSFPSIFSIPGRLPPLFIARLRSRLCSSPASVPALSLSSSPLPTTVLDSDAIFSTPDRHHHFPHHTLPSSVSVPARAATLALSRPLLPTSDYKSPKVPIPGCCSPNDSVIPFFMSFQPTTPMLNPAPTQ